MQKQDYNRPQNSSEFYEVGDYVMRSDGEIGQLTEKSVDYWDFDRMNGQFITPDMVEKNDIHSKITENEWDRALSFGEVDYKKWQAYISHLNEKYNLEEMLVYSQVLKESDWELLAGSAKLGWDQFEDLWLKYIDRTGWDASDEKEVFDQLTDFEKQSLLKSLINDGSDAFDILIQDYHARYNPEFEEEIDFDSLGLLEM